MTDPLRWGVLGAAKFAQEHMARAIHAAEGAELTALATASAEKAAGFQAFHPDLQIFADYEALLGSDAVDAVYIPLPNHLHLEWALKALDAGKHVLVEKPLGMRAEDFDPVIAKRDARGLMAAEAFMIPHHPQWQMAKKLFEDGTLGELHLVDTVFTYDNSADPGNIRNRPETGGGSLPDIGVYTMGGVRLVTGAEPLSVQPLIRRENGVDVFAHVCADFPGFRFTSVTSMRMFPRQYVAFHGTGGVMTLTAPFNAGVFDQAELHLDAPGQLRQTWRWPAVNHYVLQVQNFAAAVRGGGAYPTPLEFSRGTQAMIDMVWDAEP